MYRDLTKGSITKGLLLFALPMIAGNLLQQFYNIADTLIVGQALGVIEVLQEHGIVPGKDVLIMSIDGTSLGLEALKKGELNCVAECNPLLGPQLMKAIIDLAAGKELPLRIITDEAVFTAETPAKDFKNRQY